MIRLESLIELKCLNSSFSSSNVSIQAFRAYPLIEIGQAVPCRAIRGNGISVNSTPPLVNRSPHSMGKLSQPSLSQPSKTPHMKCLYVCFNVEASIRSHYMGFNVSVVEKQQTTPATCVCVCMCVYIYIYIHYVYVSLSLSLAIYIYIYIYIHYHLSYSTSTYQSYNNNTTNHNKHT